MAEVIDLNSKRQTSASQELPQPVVERLEKISETTVTLTKQLDEFLLAFAEEQGAPIDISIPLEALVHNVGYVAADLDGQVLPEVLQDHHQMRVNLSQEVHKCVAQFAGKQETPVYSQDIYLGMVYSLLSYIQQHRIYGVLKTHVEEPGKHAE